MNNIWILLIFILVKAGLGSKQCDAKTLYTGPELGAKSSDFYKYYCIKCNKKTNICERCKYAETLPQGGCNVHKDSDWYRAMSRKVGNIENCEGAKLDPFLNEYSCFMCTEGFALVKNSLGLFGCATSNISKCIVSEKEDNQEKCMICRNSVPSQDFSKCEDKGPYKLDDNCEFAMRHPVYNNKSASCVMCNENYALVPRMTNGSVRWECAMTSTSVNASCRTGCAKCNDQRECLWCSHYHGFYMTGAGVCSMSSQLIAFSIVALAVFFSFLQ
jgi:hypothetical protein